MNITLTLSLDPLEDTLQTFTRPPVAKDTGEWDRSLWDSNRESSMFAALTTTKQYSLKDVS